MEKDDKLWFVKDVAELAISMGVSVVVGNLIKETTPVDASKYTKVMVAIGAYSLGGLLGDMAATRMIKQAELFEARVRAGIAEMQERSRVIVVVEKDENPPKDEN